MLKVAKTELKASRFEDDANNGLAHTAESAFELRRAIRRPDAELAISKKDVNYRAKVVQAAILLLGVPDQDHRQVRASESTKRYWRVQAAPRGCGFEVHSRFKHNWCLHRGRESYWQGWCEAAESCLRTATLTSSGRFTESRGDRDGRPNCQKHQTHRPWRRNLRSMIEAEGYTFIGARTKRKRAADSDVTMQIPPRFFKRR